jgi:antitoxin component YwqK of YwqJK toxin-antitoxin module
MVKDNFSRVIKKSELKGIVNSMSSQKVTKGYMDFKDGKPDGELLLFLKDPKFNGKESIKVSMGELIGWVIQYKEQ